MNTSADQFVESPMANSYDTKPRWVCPPLHEHNILNHSSYSSSKPPEGGSEIGEKEKRGKKNNNFEWGIREHVKLGSKFSETVKGKLQLGAKIIKIRGRENIFRQVFGIREGEQMLKASQCYLSTTTGPIVGLLFISTEKVAFCCEKSITGASCQFTTTPLIKIVIPVSKIQRASRSSELNEENTIQKYIEIVGEDNSEFRFIGFLRYEKAFRNLETAISKAN